MSSVQVLQAAASAAGALEQFAHAIADGGGVPTWGSVTVYFGETRVEFDWQTYGENWKVTITEGRDPDYD